MSDSHSHDEGHVEKHEETGNHVVVEGDKQEQNINETNASINDENNHEKQNSIVENADDSVSSLTHELEHIRVTLDDESTTSATEET
ncbi:unnamed protein product, partial [Rotaria socialis]